MPHETPPTQNFDFRNKENKILEGAENKNVAAILGLMARRPLTEKE